MTARSQRATVTLPLPIHRPEHWTADAACATPDHEPRMWDGQEPGERPPAMAERQAKAKAICAECPVTGPNGPCLAYALPRPAIQGVWAGTTDAERAEMRRAQGIKPVPLDLDEHFPRSVYIRCGSVKGAWAHQKQKESMCQACRVAYNEHMARTRPSRAKGAAS